MSNHPGLTPWATNFGPLRGLKTFAISFLLCASFALAPAALGQPALFQQTAPANPQPQANQPPTPGGGQMQSQGQAATQPQSTPRQNAPQQNAPPPNAPPQNEQLQNANRPNAPRKFEAKSKPEYDAFKTADATVTSDPDLAKGEAAAGDFKTKFPQSDLTSILYDKLMKRYQQAGNDDKALAMAREELALDPQSVPALIIASEVLSQSAHDTDLDFNQKYSEATKDAKQALQLMESGAFVPAGFTPEQMNGIRAMAYATIGNLEFIRAGNENLSAGERVQADAAAEQALRQSVQLDAANPDPGEWLRLAVTLDHEKKYPDALQAANQAVSFSANAPNVLALAQQEQTRLKGLIGGAPAGTQPH